MSDPALVWLLDKNVIRRAVEGIGKSLVEGVLSSEGSLAIRLLVRGIRTGARSMITPEAANILNRHNYLLPVRLFMAEVKVMCRSRYFKRWARRLQEHNFTREDARVLSYGTFGLDPSGLVIGANLIITFDQPFIRNFESQQAVLRQRLRAMTAQLHSPYREAALPDLSCPERALQRAAEEQSS